MSKQVPASLGLALATLAAITGSAAAEPKPDSQADFDRAMAAHDYHAARLAFNALIAERLPANDHTAPDPVLDRDLADVVTVSGNAGIIDGVLQRLVSTGPAASRAHYRLLLAAAHENAGQLDTAISEYHAISGDRAAQPRDRAGAVIGAARLTLAADPAGALAMLDAAGAVDPADRWEVELMRARAAAVAGKDDLFQTAIDQAWAYAPAAGPEQAAVARVAGDRATAAGRLGNRTALAAMLSVDRLNRGMSNGYDYLSRTMPVCGQQGIRPDDAVVVEFMRQPAPGRPHASLVWASRPGIGNAFIKAIMVADGFIVADGQAADAMLRCQTATGVDYNVPPKSLPLLLTDWLTSHGAYPLNNDDQDMDSVALAGMLADREHRYGPSSIMLLPVLALISIQDVPGPDSPKPQLERTAAMVHRTLDIATANKAPMEILLMVQMSATGLDLASQKISLLEAQNQFRSMLGQAMRDPSLHLDVLYSTVKLGASSDRVPIDARIAMLSSAIDIFKARAGRTDPQTLGLALTLYRQYVTQGRNADAQKIVADFGLAPDLCDLADPPTSYLSSDIRSDDYPNDLVQAMIQGRSTLEFNVTPSGEIAATRLIAAEPPYAFDAIAMTKSTTIRYQPTVKEGKPAGCRVKNQTVRWQLPY